MNESFQGQASVYQRVLPRGQVLLHFLTITMTQASILSVVPLTSFVNIMQFNCHLSAGSFFSGFSFLVHCACLKGGLVASKGSVMNYFDHLRFQLNIRMTHTSVHSFVNQHTLCVFIPQGFCCNRAIDWYLPRLLSSNIHFYRFCK